jgi:adenosine deaminase
MMPRTRARWQPHAEGTRYGADGLEREAMELSRLAQRHQLLTDARLVGDVPLPKVEASAHGAQHPATLGVIHRAMFAHRRLPDTYHALTILAMTGKARSGNQVDAFDAIPKVELHCHAEGTIRPATVIELARESGRRLPTEDPTELYRYTSLDSFLDIFWLVQSLLADADDWERIGYESLVDAAPHGLRYREMFFTPARHIAAGQRLTDIVAGLSRGIERAEAETGVQCMLICDIDRAFGDAAALELVEAAGELRRTGGAERLIGIGMDSTELGVDPRDFADAFALAARLGFRRTAHAGEDTGPENIAIAIDALGIERVDHGLAILDDAKLTARVADKRIPLTVCPNSNVLIANKFERLADHPFRRMRQVGLLATLNTDDPAMTDLDLGREYRSVAHAQRMPWSEVVDVSLDGIEASWLSDAEKRAMRSSFEREIASIVMPG